MMLHPLYRRHHLLLVLAGASLLTSVLIPADATLDFVHGYTYDVLPWSFVLEVAAVILLLAWLIRLLRRS